MRNVKSVAPFRTSPLCAVPATPRTLHARSMVRRMTRCASARRAADLCALLQALRCVNAVPRTRRLSCTCRTRTCGPLWLHAATLLPARLSRCLPTRNRSGRGSSPWLPPRAAARLALPIPRQSRSAAPSAAAMPAGAASCAAWAATRPSIASAPTATCAARTCACARHAGTPSSDAWRVSLSNCRRKRGAAWAADLLTWLGSQTLLRSTLRASGACETSAAYACALRRGRFRLAGQPMGVC